MDTDNNFTPTALSLLDAFVRQRPGIDPRNYGDSASYNAERSQVTRDLYHYRAIRTAVSWRSFTLAQWQAAFSNRLTLERHGDGWRLDYCTGQYFATEFRKAACAVLASLLWADARENMPAPGTAPVGSGKAEEDMYWDGKRAVHAGDWLRGKFRREFSRAVARRYFD